MISLLLLIVLIKIVSLTRFLWFLAGYSVIYLFIKYIREDMMISEAMGQSGRRKASSIASTFSSSSFSSSFSTAAKNTSTSSHSARWDSRTYSEPEEEEEEEEQRSSLASMKVHRKRHRSHHKHKVVSSTSLREITTSPKSTRMAEDDFSSFTTTTTTTKSNLNQNSQAERFIRSTVTIRKIIVRKTLSSTKDELIIRKSRVLKTKRKIVTIKSSLL